MILRNLAVTFAAALSAFAQGGPAVVSPEVSPDRHVTFRVLAPKANEVGLTIDYGSEKLTKDDKGVWSVTVGPLESGDYVYSFTVDGVAIPDPINPRIKLRARTSASLLQVPGDKPEMWEARDVPHGAVAINWQRSSVLNNETRSFWVYTPPGYEKETTRKYPVLYLLHGSNDTQAGWTTAGNVNYILDNMIAEKRAVPMIVVMPFGHALPFGGGGGRGAGGGGGRGAGGAAAGAGRGAGGGQAPANSNTLLFEKYLLTDVMPTVDGKYRTLTTPDAHAIAGMSMGGEQALAIAFGHPELFSAIGGLSPSMPRELADRWAPALADPKGTNARMKVIWIGCGRQDYRPSERLPAPCRIAGDRGREARLLGDRRLPQLFPMAASDGGVSAPALPEVATSPLTPAYLQAKFDTLSARITSDSFSGM